MGDADDNRYQTEPRKEESKELGEARMRLRYMLDERQNRADELVLANEEKANRALELADILIRLKDAHELAHEYRLGLEELIFRSSHIIRPPIINICGLTDILKNKPGISADALQIIDKIKSEAYSLDVFTRNLSKYLATLKKEAATNEDRDKG